MRGGAICVLAAVAGCDLVFPPSRFGRDASPGVPDGAHAAPDADLAAPDGRFDATVMPDAPPGSPDAACGVTCLGDLGNDGSAPCSAAHDWCVTPELDTLDTSDLCSCSNGTPALVVYDVVPGVSMRIVLLAEFPGTYFLQVDGAGCLDPPLACSVATICTAGGPVEIEYYDAVVPTGSAMDLSVWLDSLCETSPYADFTYLP